MSLCRRNRKSDRKNIKISVNYLTQEGITYPDIEALDTAFELLNIYRISCKEGLLAIENMAEEGMLNKFLTFTVKKVFECFRQEMNTDLIRRLLENYCQAEENKLIARMTVDVVM